MPRSLKPAATSVVFTNVLKLQAARQGKVQKSFGSGKGLAQSLNKRDSGVLSRIDCYRYIMGKIVAEELLKQIKVLLPKLIPPLLLGTFGIKALYRISTMRCKSTLCMS